MIIAMPVLQDNGEESQISRHFGHNPLFAVYNSEKQNLKIVNVGTHGRGCTPIEPLEKLNVDAVYTFGIGSRAISILKQKGITLRTGDLTRVKEVIENLENLEELESGCGH